METVGLVNLLSAEPTPTISSLLDQESAHQCRRETKRVCMDAEGCNYILL